MTAMTDESLVAVLGESLQEKIREGKITLAEVVNVLTPTEPEKLPEAFKAPLPAVITTKVSKALEALPGQFGGVVPTERRLLSDEELVQILEERDTIDIILKALKDRKDKSIRTTVLNHIDVALEDELSEERLGELERDPEGHYYYAEKVNVAYTGKAFSWEVQDGSSNLSPDKLKALDEAGEIDHDLYLSITDQVRVVNEQKVLLAMSKQPEAVLAAIQKASTAGTRKKGSLYVRNAG